MEEEGNRSSQEEELTVSTVIPFLKFAEASESISNSKSTADKLRKLDKFLFAFRKTYIEFYGSLDSTVGNGDSIFPIIRLLCPSWDRERSAYGIKDTVLGRMMVDIIGLSKDSKERKKLCNYKDPEVAGKDAGDMGSIIFSVLNRRFSNTDRTDGPTVHDLHVMLDQLAKGMDDEDGKVTQQRQKKILQEFFHRLTALEGKWLAKIILKKLDLGLTESSIFNLVHPKAKELLDVMSLLEVCRICNDPAVDCIQQLGHVALFTSFRSMKCERLNIGSANGDDVESEFSPIIISKSKNKPIVLPPPPFFVETKFDGERFQIHFERLPTGEVIFQYFSHGSHNYKIFNETLTPRLKSQISKQNQVESFVLDGEMMAYSYKNKNFTTKGQSIDVKTLDSDNRIHCPAFVAWDLVFYNGESICEKPLATRLELLKQIIVPKEGIIYVSEQKECRNLEGVMALLNEAIEKNEEGIVIKDPRSIYQPGQRKMSWLKLKPQYVGGYRVNDLDLLIIGGYYTDRKRRIGTIESFLLGVVDGKDIYPLTKAGCGRLKHYEFASLVSSLEPHFVKDEIPGTGIKFKGKRPDVFIDPKKSVVLEVNGAEILRSKEYAINYCLRFPIVSRIRRDKPWNEAMTVSEFHDLRKSCKNGAMLKKRPQQGATGTRFDAKVKKEYFGQTINFDGSSGDEGGPGTSSTGRARKLKKTKAESNLSPSKILDMKQAIATGTRMLEQGQGLESNLFHGKVFNVIGSWDWMADMERKLKRHGAEIVKNPTPDTFAILAEKQTITVKNKMKVGKWNILNGATWVNSCIEEESLRDFLPEHLFYATEPTKETFAKDYDIYGDSFKREVSVHELKNLVQRLIVQEEEQKSQGNVEAMDMKKARSELEQEIMRIDPSYSQWCIFQNYKIGFFPRVDAVHKDYIEFYKGEVVENWESPEVTHIVVLQGHDQDSGCPKTTSTQVLSSAWIDACVRIRKLVDTESYRL